MPFPSTLSAGEITQVRKTEQWFEHYLLVCPNDIIWQAQINENISGSVFAEFVWDTTLQGDRTNVLVGMTVLITSDANDFSSPIFRGRIRSAAPTATVVTINEAGIDITTSMFVTVLDDFDLHSRLIKVDATGAEFKDWDVSWKDLPPTISGLQSTYADFSKSAFVIAFDPTGTANASGAAISTWLWDVGDGTVTVNTINDRNPTVSFPITSEQRWVHITVTDDNGNSTTFHLEVYTVDKDSATAVKLDSGSISMTATADDGYNTSITAWNGFTHSTVLDQTRVTLVSRDNYDGTTTPILTNIMMVGRLKIEDNVTEVTEQDGNVADVQLQIDGFATQLAALDTPHLPIFDEDSPDAWGEITDPTLSRTSVYLWAFHTTLLTLCSLETDDFSTFISDEFSLQIDNALDVINNEALSVNAQVLFAASGEIGIRRNGNYLATAARDGLDTIFGFTTADIIVIDNYNIIYGQQIGQVESGGLVYNTTSNEISDVFIGHAPSEGFGKGQETAQLNGQILVADSSTTAARQELGQRTANHLAFVNFKPQLTITVMDGFYFLVPTNYQWYTVTLAAADTTRGRALTTSTRWLLQSINYTSDSEKNTRQTQMVLVEETENLNASILVTRVADINENLFAPPPLSPYLAFPEDPLINFPTDSPTTGLPFNPSTAIGVEPMPSGAENESAINSETLSVPMYFNQAVLTTRASTIGQTYTVTVRGDGTIGGNWTRTYQFDTPSGNEPNTDYDAASWTQFDPVHAPDWDKGVHESGVGWKSETANGNPRRIAIGIQLPGAGSTIVAAQITLVKNDAASSLAVSVGYGENVDDVIEQKQWVSPGTTETHNFGTVQNGEWLYYNASFNNDGPLVLTQFIITGRDSNPYGTSGSAGDAFYFGYDAASSNAQLYASNQGFLIGSAKPSAIPLYDATHNYSFTIPGTGNQFSFSYFDSDYTDNSRNVLRVTVTGNNMGPTA